jgi:hypothetical protein
MPIDRTAAERFIWSAARLVDRHRFAMLFAGGPGEPVLRALSGYQNDDGGFGHALEPDLRCPQSQPPATLYALETLEEAGGRDGELAHSAGRGAELVQGAVAWLDSISDPSGGIPSVLPGFEAYPHAPWYAFEPVSFLTLGVVAALPDGALPRATEWAWREVERAEHPTPYWLKYALVFLDAAPDEDRARAAIDRLRGVVDPATLAPPGGVEGERLRPLDLSPHPGKRSRALFSEEDIEKHLDEVEEGQLEDGGWMFDWRAWSPAQTAAWRGLVTIRALTWLRDNGRSS